MSNQNYRLEEKNSKKIDVHLLYITEAKYEQDWHSLAHTHHFTACFQIFKLQMMLDKRIQRIKGNIVAAGVSVFKLVALFRRICLLKGFGRIYFSCLLQEKSGVMCSGTFQAAREVECSKLPCINFFFMR